MAAVWAVGAVLFALPTLCPVCCPGLACLAPPTPLLQLEQGWSRGGYTSPRWRVTLADMSRCAHILCMLVCEMRTVLPQDLEQSSIHRTHYVRAAGKCYSQQGAVRGAWLSSEDRIKDAEVRLQE